VSLVRMRSVVWRTNGQSILDGVDLTVRAGEVLGLAGGTGSGKSALVGILAGELMPDSGEVVIAGNPVLRPEFTAVVRVIRDPDAVALDRSVAENVFVGAEPHTRFGLVDRREMRRRAGEVLERLGLRVDPALPARRLSPVLRCAVQAANALVAGVRVVALDGVSAVMPADEVRHLNTVVGKLAEAGIAVLVASRCVQELREICDRITILRDGHVAGTFVVGDADPAELADGMLEPETAKSFTRRREPVCDEPVLEVRGLRSGSDVRDVSFSVAGGEIVALIGDGRTEVGKALFGASPVDGGEILVHGESLRLRTPGDAISAGIGYLSESQERSGLVAGRTVGGNLGMLTPVVTRSRRAQQRLVANTRTLLGIECPSADAPVDRLTTGDQRKLGLAKWLAAESEVLVLDEPGGTVNGNVRVEIRWMIRELAAAGVAVVVISSDANEVLDLADRVVVLRDGRTVCSLSAAEATESDVVRLVTGVDPWLCAARRPGDAS
jgi:ABC-type sugar transport system ATPase subunit